MDSLKGILYLTMVPFALLIGAAVLPDSAWEQIPAKLTPVRTFLAGRGVISDRFLPVSMEQTAASVPPVSLDAPADVLLDKKSPSGDWTKKSPNETAFNEKTPNETASAKECPGGVCPVPIFGNPRSASAAENKSASSEPSAPASPDGFPLLADSALAQPVPLSADTLPDLSFEDAPAGKSFSSAPVPLPIPVQNPSAPSVSSNPSAVPAAPISAEPKLPDNLPVMNSFPAEALPAQDPISGVSAESVQQFPIPIPAAIGSSASSPADYTAPSAESTPQTAALLEAALKTRLDAALAQSEIPEKTLESFLELNRILNESGKMLSAGDRSRLNLALDRLAFEVFYRPESNLLEPAYLVRPGETLASIAAQYGVEPALLAVLNQQTAGMNDPLPAGTRLKVVRGPISAQVSMERMELLLKINGLYAGRFKMGCAQAASTVRGEFAVTRKILRPDYSGPLANGQAGVIAGGDPANPLGPCWIELAGGLGLQGTNHPESIGQSNLSAGGLIFSNQDITHLNILLPVGAMVEITD